MLPPQSPASSALAENRSLIALGGYKWILGGSRGALGLLGSPLFPSRARAATDDGDAPVSAPPTLAERLRPLVELASAGKLTADEKAQLERMLLGHWRERLGLESLEPRRGHARLRAHPEAGVLLRALEDWLHRPPGSVKVDIDAVLAPYANAPTAGNPIRCRWKSPMSFAHPWLLLLLALPLLARDVGMAARGASTGAAA